MKKQGYLIVAASLACVSFAWASYPVTTSHYFQQQLQRKLPMVQMAKSLSGPRTNVHTCQQYQQALKQGLQPATQLDQNFSQAYLLQCRAAQLVAQAIPAKKNYFQGFSLAKDRQQLPKSINACLYHCAKVKSQSQAKIGKNGAYQNLVILARGDFNHSGMQQLLLYQTIGVKGGSFHVGHLYVLSRNGEKAVIKAVEIGSRK